MFEAERLQVKGQPAVADLPLLGEIEELPFTAALLASVIMPVPVLPAAVGPQSIPDHLGIRTDQKILSPAFQLLAHTAIYDLIIFPFICNPHII